MQNRCVNVFIRFNRKSSAGIELFFPIHFIFQSAFFLVSQNLTWDSKSRKVTRTHLHLD